MVIVYGRLSIRLDALDGLTFEDAKKNNPSIKESLLLGAWKIANPKGKMKNETPKKEKEDK